MNTLTESRITRVFMEQSNKPLFIPFITAGDPAPEVTVELVETLAGAGADVIELGVPYSDPLADGPTIQAASERALKQGVTLTSVLEMAATIRKKGLTVPLVLFTYYNPILRIGIDQLCERATAAGFDGMIVPDLPYEENAQLLNAAERNGLALIPLVAPTSEKRIQRLVSNARGFVYCVSSLGTTGTRDSFAGDTMLFLDRVRRLSPIPIAVGFGISKREHVVQFAPHVDAVIVGSALVRQIESVRDELLDPDLKKSGLQRIAQFVRMLKNE